MKISTKIIVACMALGAISTTAFLGTVLVQRELLRDKLEVVIADQALSEAGKIVETLYVNCEATERRNQTRLTHDLGLAREVLARHGEVTLDSEKVTWNAINQLTRDTQSIELPQLLVGTNWFGQNFSPKEASLVVDEVKHLTLDECTVFQRMNEQGDMLRVCTSILGTNGNRAIGTFIARKNPDGSANAVLEKVLNGGSFRGRAFVVNEFYATAYEPIWNADKSRIIGMLYVGMSMRDINKEFHDSMTQIVVGKTGRVFVLGGKGDSRGRYIVSPQGQRNGESIWETKDANGNLVAQSIVTKALQTSDGALTNEIFQWQDAGDAGAREKFATFTYFAPWDWIIGAEAFEDDYRAVSDEVTAALAKLLRWTLVMALGLGVLGLVLSYTVARGIARPVLAVVEQLKLGAGQTHSAAAQVSGSSQALASGASQQAASIEETSASMEELLAMTRRNSEASGRASDLSRETRAAADAGVSNIKQMNASVQQLRAANTEVAKIIKTIDDIAFQTNLLALNAAVEAARAGEAGAGFAVVADEVRALSARSATAAKETEEKITSALANTKECVELCQHAATLLDRIATHARGLEQIANEVAGASREQSSGIDQVNQAVGQLDKVTQHNAAASEECAAAAQQLKSQADSLHEAVAELRSLVNGNSSEAVTSESPAAPREGKQISVAANPVAPTKTFTPKRKLQSVAPKRERASNVVAQESQETAAEFARGL